MIPEPLWFVIAATFGLVFGSFITSLSYRLPRDESIARGRSRCPACSQLLSARDLVPVFSWVFHKGTCRHCGARVSWRYPVIELITAAFFVAAAAFVPEVAHLGLLLAMTPMMVALAVIDTEYQRLPNVLIAVLAVLAIAWRWTGDGALLAGLAVAAIVIVAGILIDAGYKALKGRGGLGLGEAKLIAVGGVALGLGPFLLFLSVTGLFGVVLSAFWQRVPGSRAFPFGPAILASLWICLTGGEFMLQGLVSLLSG